MTTTEIYQKLKKAERDNDTDLAHELETILLARMRGGDQARMAIKYVEIGLRGSRTIEDARYSITNTLAEYYSNGTPEE